MSAREGGGPRIEEIPSSDEEANAFIFGLEKRKQVSTYVDYEDARHAWESASQEQKAGAALRTAIKLKKEHSYAVFEEGQKWQRLQAKGPASKKSTAAVQKRRFPPVPVKVEPLQEEPAAMESGTWHASSWGGSPGAPEQADTEQTTLRMTKLGMLGMMAAMLQLAEGPGSWPKPGCHAEVQ